MVTYFEIMEYFLVSFFSFGDFFVSHLLILPPECLLHQSPPF